MLQIHDEYFNIEIAFSIMQYKNFLATSPLREQTNERTEELDANIEMVILFKCEISKTYLVRKAV